MVQEERRGEGDGWLEVGPRWRPLEREGDGLTGREGRRGWAARGGVDRKLFLFCFYRLEEQRGEASEEVAIKNVVQGRRPGEGLP